MARASEILGIQADTVGHFNFNPQTWICPFSTNPCDGGGNREQTSLMVNEYPKLSEIFSEGIERVVPAICSLETRDGKWVICPRRLFSPPEGLNNLGNLPSHVKTIIKTLRDRSTESNKIGIWKEVKIRHSSGGSRFDYSFDYVMHPIDDQLTPIPEASPQILEVMTCSTSGSSTKKGTDIASVFIKNIEGEVAPAPNINKRQVWGRMGTQLFAKSALAEAWGGKTSWIVQDLLINELATATALNPRICHSEAEAGVVIFVSLFVDPNKHGDNPTLEGIYKIPHGLNDDSASGLKILLPPVLPPKDSLISSLKNQAASSIIQL